MNRFAWISIFSLLVCAGARAESGIVELGHGDDVRMGRLAWQFDSGKRWFTDGDWHVTNYWEPAVGFWRGKSSKGDPHIFEIAFTPVLRLEKKSLTPWSPYLESGVGVHLITGHHVTDDRDLASNYHFGSHVGFGLRFGARNEFDVGYRLQHLSNAGLKQPNRGINFNILHLRYSY
ncbi:MAG: acyloxyacyl hydrolase [Burkholderiales bacterium]